MAYDGRIEEIVLSIAENTCDDITVINVYRNPGAYTTGTRKLLHTYTIPDLRYGEWHLRPKRHWYFKKHDLLVIEVDTHLSTPGDGIHVAAAVEYKRAQVSETLKQKSIGMNQYQGAPV